MLKLDKIYPKIPENFCSFFGNVDKKNLPARWRLTKIQFGMA
jgi:hypothetical protein